MSYRNVSETLKLRLYQTQVNTEKVKITSWEVVDMRDYEIDIQVEFS
jgi:hypothetical protein